MTLAIMLHDDVMMTYRFISDSDNSYQLICVRLRRN